MLRLLRAAVLRQEWEIDIDCDYLMFECDAYVKTLTGIPLKSEDRKSSKRAKSRLDPMLALHGIGPDLEMVNLAMHDWRNPVAQITIRRIH